MKAEIVGGGMVCTTWKDADAVAFRPAASVTTSETVKFPRVVEVHAREGVLCEVHPGGRLE